MCVCACMCMSMYVNVFTDYPTAACPVKASWADSLKTTAWLDCTRAHAWILDKDSIGASMIKPRLWSM